MSTDNPNWMSQKDPDVFDAVKLLSPWLIQGDQESIGMLRHVLITEKEQKDDGQIRSPKIIVVNFMKGLGLTDKNIYDIIESDDPK